MHRCPKQQQTLHQPQLGKEMHGASDGPGKGWQPGGLALSSASRPDSIPEPL